MIKICIVSSGQPSSNPRIVKEAQCIALRGHEVSVVYSQISNWATNLDKDFVALKSEINWICVNEGKIQNPINFFKIRIRKKIWEIIYLFFGDVFNSDIKSSVLFSQDLVKAAIKVQADLYIGHNLGALPAIIIASKHYNAKASFDFEDFHRGEYNAGDTKSQKVKQIEDKYVPLLDYATCASPLIEGEYKKLYPFLKTTTINNCFPYFYKDKNKRLRSRNEEIKLFWFSQNIGKERGLEDVIRAIGLVNDNRIKLTLLGNSSDYLKKYFNNISIESELSSDQLVFLDPVPEKELVKIGMQHHIGIASEILLQENRNYCLTNKIFIYLLAENAILFSNTKAQKEFLNQQPEIGFLYNQGRVEEIADYLKTYIQQPTVLENQRNKSGQLGRDLNWEKESLKLLDFYSLL